MPVTPIRRRLLLAAVLLGPLAWQAQAASIINRANSGPALLGHDPVAYFRAGQPVPGQARFNTEWQGASWWFANDENRQAFVADPERYAPQYGGYCAYAMAGDAFASGDPRRWKIVEGKLYLNANLLAQKLWERDIPAKIKSADGYWPGKRRELEARP